MDKEIQQKIVDFLRGQEYGKIPDIVTHLNNYSQIDIQRIINHMKDRGELTTHPNVDYYIRLTDTGLKANKPFKDKVIPYLSLNWIAIVGAITGITGTIISIIALTKK